MLQSKKKKYKIPKMLLLMVLGVSVALYFSYFLQFAAPERLVYSVEIDSTSGVTQQKDIVLDLAKQALPKKIGQPDKVAIVAGSLKNLTAENLSVEIEVEGFQGKADLQSVDKAVVLGPNRLSLEIRAKQALRNIPQVEVTVLPENQEKYLQSQGLIRLKKLDGTILKEVAVQVVNSAYRI